MNDGLHHEHEDHAWTIEIPDHPKRSDSAGYVASRKEMHKVVDTVDPFFLGKEKFEDHHGGGLWLKDADGWFMVRNLAGIEWSAQFCADPVKVDALRRNAQRLYAAFPDARDALGIGELLDTPITDAAGIARWTDSICNASVPLPHARHVGIVPGSSTGGIHHYPSPITEIDFFRRDDFTLWVETAEGSLAAVVPVAPFGSGDGRTRVLLAQSPQPTDQPTPMQVIEGLAPKPARGAEHELGAAAPAEEWPILSADHPVSRSAFRHQV